jgi:hypothetical protein
MGNDEKNSIFESKKEDIGSSAISDLTLLLDDRSETGGQKISIVPQSCHLSGSSSYDEKRVHNFQV